MPMGNGGDGRTSAPGDGEGFGGGSLLVLGEGDGANPGALLQSSNTGWA